MYKFEDLKKSKKLLTLPQSKTNFSFDFYKCLCLVRVLLWSTEAKVPVTKPNTFLNLAQKNSLQSHLAELQSNFFKHTFFFSPLVKESIWQKFR